MEEKEITNAPGQLEQLDYTMLFQQGYGDLLNYNYDSTKTPEDLNRIFYTIFQGSTVKP